MKMYSIEYCIDHILLEIENRRNVDYADKKSVQKYNLAYDRFYKNVKYIDEHYPESIGVLVDLLDHPDPDVCGHIAPLTFKLDNATLEHKEKALQAVRRIIASPETDPLDRMGFSLSLEDWEKEVHPD